MNDSSIKRWLGYALRNKETLCRLLDFFRPEDLENGLLSLPESLFNDQLAPAILGAASPWVNSFHISFSPGRGLWFMRSRREKGKEILHPYVVL